jgi:7-cyano-7-deazaguanine reductase
MGRRHEAAMSQLETFANPKPGRDYLIEHTCHEFTSVCPKTNQARLRDAPNSLRGGPACVELRA